MAPELVLWNQITVTDDAIDDSLGEEEV